jgi:hypothetical protein
MLLSQVASQKDLRKEFHFPFAISSSVSSLLPISDQFSEYQWLPKTRSIQKR